MVPLPPTHASVCAPELYSHLGGDAFLRGFRQRFNEGMSDLESQKFIEVLRACAVLACGRFLREIAVAAHGSSSNCAHSSLAV